MRLFFLIANTVAAILMVSAPAMAQSLPIVRLNAGMHLIQAEVAATPETRAKGLMFREKLAPNHGMLFVFEEKIPQCFWMRNTLIPLSIAFLDEDGTIINIETMAPQTDTNHCAKTPPRYALEMSSGWFSDKGVLPGMKLGGLASQEASLK